MRAWKLISTKGTLLGTITFPKHWECYLEDGGSARFEYRDLGTRFAMRSPSLPERLCSSPTYEVGTLARAWNWPTSDGLLLCDITIEQFEQLPGCSFSASAAYLRSLLDG